jgi:hypothetical protein
MSLLTTAATLRDMRIVLTHGLSFVNLQLRVKPLQFTLQQKQTTLSKIVQTSKILTKRLVGHHHQHIGNKIL